MSQIDKETLLSHLKNGQPIDELVLTDYDLQHCDLKGIKLEGITFKQVNFSVADLSQCVLNACIFSGCNFSRANLNQSDLSLCQFTVDYIPVFQESDVEISFELLAMDEPLVTEIRKTGICGFKLAKNTFVNADLSHAKLPDSRLDQVDFSTANLQYCDLSGALVSSCRFNRADLTGTNFTAAQCIESHFNEQNIYEEICKRITEGLNIKKTTFSKVLSELDLQNHIIISSNVLNKILTYIGVVLKKGEIQLLINKIQTSI